MSYQRAAFPLRIICLCILQILILFSNAQTPHFQWVKNFGTSGTNAAGVSLALDENKSIVTTGHFYNTIDFDAGPGVFNQTSNGDQDVFVTRYDTGGVFMWAKQFGGLRDDYVKDMKLDRDGNVIILGLFQGTVDLDPGPDVVNFSVGPGTNFLVKLDRNGNYIWARKFDLLYKMNNLAVDAFNNILIGGSFAGTRDFDPGPDTYNATTAGRAGDDLFVLKLSSEGNFTWLRQMQNSGGSEQSVQGLEVDAENSIYLAGNYTETIDFDPGTGVTSLPATGKNDAFVLKLDQHGDYKWANRWGGDGSVKLLGLAVTSDGTVYTTGHFLYTANFDPGSSNYSLTSPALYYSGYVSKFDRQGNFLFAKGLIGEGSYGNSICVDSTGDIYIAGGYHGTVDFDPGPSTFTLSKGQLFTLKLAEKGDFAWVAGYAITTPTGFFTSVYSGAAIVVDILKNVYHTGQYAISTDFDPALSTHALTPKGNWDAYIHKISQCASFGSVSATLCSSYTLNGVTYTSPGTYYQVLPGAAGCDSILSLHLSYVNDVHKVSAINCNSYTWAGKKLNNSGLYYDTLQSMNGCDSIVELQLTINRSIDTTIHEEINDGESFAGYTKSGSYIDTFIAANGCDSIRTLTLLVRKQIIAHLNVSICEGEFYLGYAASGQYIDTLSTSSGLDSIRVLQLTVNPKKITNRTAAICEGESYFAGGINRSISGVYIDSLRTSLGCDSLVLTTLTVHKNPVINLGGDRSLCAGSTLLLSPGNYTSYQWQDQSTATSLVVKDTGHYWVKAYNDEGCSAVDSIYIHTIVPLPSDFLKERDSICRSQVLQLASNRSFTTYQWSTGSFLPSITIDQPGTYTLTVRDANSCVGMDTISVIQKTCVEGFFAPNAFTPNNDGKNDVFRPLLFGNVKQYRFAIYNRWGEVVFQTMDLQKSWDGRVGGIQQETGVFVWTCTYQMEGEVVKQEKGSVTLIR